MCEVFRELLVDCIRVKAESSKSTIKPGVVVIVSSGIRSNTERVDFISFVILQQITFLMLFYRFAITHHLSESLLHWIRTLTPFELRTSDFLGHFKRV